jgi:chitosanase
MGRFAIAGMMLASLAGCGGTQVTPNGDTPPPGGADDPGSTNSANDLGTTTASGDGDVVPGGGGGGGGGDMATGGPSGPLTANQKAVAEAMTSIWENDTPILDYAYSENIKDGRGYTSGRAGFCTGTGDAIQVIDCFDKLRTSANGNLMAKYMPALTTINNKYNSTGQDQGDTSLLDAVGNWVNDWGASYTTTTTRADFAKCQDQISDLLYYTPAMQAAMQVGLTTALTRAALYDMWINQGDDTLVTQTNTALGVKATIGVGNAVTEDAWLQKFIELRRDLLAGDSTWKTSVDRVAGYEKARRRGNWDLSKPVDSAVKAKECWPAGGYLDSQYTSWIINADGSSAKTTMATSCQ